jgi:hypothetical protein
MSVITVDRIRNEWFEWFRQKRNNGYLLYLLTCTYLPHPHRRVPLEEHNKQFSVFWTRVFLPSILGSHFRSTNAQKNRQPIAISFVEKNKPLESDNGDRYHHHAIVAALPIITQSIDRYLGSRSLSRSTPHAYIESTDLQRIADDTLGRTVKYATKDIENFQEYLVFGYKNATPDLSSAIHSSGTAQIPHHPKPESVPKCEGRHLC